MSHVNITMRERHSTYETMRDQIAILEAKLKLADERLASAETSLASIFERIKKGERVYLCYDDGSTIDIQAVPTATRD